MNTNTKTIVGALAVLAILVGLFVWQSNKSPEQNPQGGENGTEVENGSTSLRSPDSDLPTAPACGFQPGDAVTFSISEGIPGPRCARVLSTQNIAFTNSTSQSLQFSFAGQDLNIAPGATSRIERSVGEYLAPGVHHISMDFYAGSGPQVWVSDSSVIRTSGEVTQTFVSASALVLDTENGEEISIAIDSDTRISNTSGAGVSSENFSLTLIPGTSIEAIVDMEDATTGKALEIRVIE